VQKLMHGIITCTSPLCLKGVKQDNFHMKIYHINVQIINLAAFRWFVITDLQVLVHCKCSEFLKSCIRLQQT